MNEIAIVQVLGAIDRWDRAVEVAKMRFRRHKEGCDLAGGSVDERVLDLLLVRNLELFRRSARRGGDVQMLSKNVDGLR
jgi:hypothetical protein